MHAGNVVARGPTMQRIGSSRPAGTVPVPKAAPKAVAVAKPVAKPAAKPAAKAAPAKKVFEVIFA